MFLYPFKARRRGLILSLNLLAASKIGYCGEGFSKVYTQAFLMPDLSMILILKICRYLLEKYKLL